MRHILAEIWLWRQKWRCCCYSDDDFSATFARITASFHWIDSSNNHQTGEREKVQRKEREKLQEEGMGKGMGKDSINCVKGVS